MDIHELNKRRATAQLYLETLGMLNAPTDYDKRVAADARYALAQEAATAADRDYRDAMARLSTEEKVALSRSDTSP